LAWAKNRINGKEIHIKCYILLYFQALKCVLNPNLLFPHLPLITTKMEKIFYDPKRWQNSINLCKS
jgi:hypothetical protein